MRTLRIIIKRAFDRELLADFGKIDNLADNHIFYRSKRRILQGAALLIASAVLTVAAPVFAAGDQAAPQATSPAAPAASDGPPTAPGLPNPQQADDAEIVIRSKAARVDKLLSTPTGAPITIDAPVVFYLQRAANSSATRFVYALVRDGHTVVSSDRPLGLTTNLIKLQHRSATTPGLRAGPVTLYVWGIDQINRISPSKRVELTILGED